MTTTPTLTDVDAQRVIDEKISEYEAAIFALKTQRNTHSTVSKIPIELTAKIFLHAKQSYFQDESHSYSRRQGRNWLNVSSVCRQWRAIVLDTPRLWCSIDLSWEAQRISEFLERSKSVPLQIRCKSHSYDGVRFESVAKVVMSRSIQGLDISVKDIGSLERFLELNPSGSAPALEVLKLVSDRPYSPSTILPSLWHDMPALRTLELDTIRLSSQLPMLPCLTKLILQCSVGKAIPASWLIQSLLNTPVIQEIDISGMSLDLGTTPPIIPRISLAKLTSLHILACDLSMSNVFDYLDYPISAIVKFSAPAEDVRDSPDFSSLQRLCSRFATGARETSTDQVRIDVKGLACEVQFWASEAGSSPHLSIVLSMSHLIKCVQLCSSLPLATVHKLSLESQYKSISEWFTLFPLFQQLTTLELIKCGDDIFTGLLRRGDMQKPPFEKLETIVMRNCMLNFSYNERHKWMCDAVIRVLTQRKELGIAIRKLQVEKCDVTKDVIKELGGYVAIEWDGFGLEEEEDDTDYAEDSD